jgi:hypothetical protein
MLQWLYMYVASVFSNFLAISSGCCSGYTHMLQVYVPNVSPVSDVCCKCFYLNVAYVIVVIHICCKCIFQYVAAGVVPHML